MGIWRILSGPVTGNQRAPWLLSQSWGRWFFALSHFLKHRGVREGGGFPHLNFSLGFLSSGELSHCHWEEDRAGSEGSDSEALLVKGIPSVSSDPGLDANTGLLINKLLLCTWLHLTLYPESKRNIWNVRKNPNRTLRTQKENWTRSGGGREDAKSCILKDWGKFICWTEIFTFPTNVCVGDPAFLGSWLRPPVKKGRLTVENQKLITCMPAAYRGDSQGTWLTPQHSPSHHLKHHPSWRGRSWGKSGEVGRKAEETGLQLLCRLRPFFLLHW